MEAKIDILFYLFGICMLLWVVRTLINLKKQMFSRVRDKCSIQLSEWAAKGEYQTLLQEIDSMITRYPGDPEFVWAKARALFKVDKDAESLVLFEKISRQEPLWKDDAEKYIASIRARMQNIA